MIHNRMATMVLLAHAGLLPTGLLGGALAAPQAPGWTEPKPVPPPTPQAQQLALTKAQEKRQRRAARRQGGSR